MSQLIRLRRQIKSIETTKKITYAMRLISMSLYGKLETQGEPLAHYRQMLAKLFSEITTVNVGWDNPILFPKDTSDSRPLIIIVASTKGLCGSFNSTLFRHIKRELELQGDQKPTFVTIGSKSRNFVSDEGLAASSKQFNDFNSSNFLHIADDLTEIITEAEEPFTSVTFYSNFFRSFFVQKPDATRIIPFSTEELPKEEGQPQSQPSEDIISELIWEQDPHLVLDFLSLRYLRGSICHLLFQSLLAEQASRFVAMDNATSNADKFLERLTIRYNKARQALITKELSELTASFG